MTVLHFSPLHFLWAIVLGGLSAASLPLGSLVGIKFRPRPFCVSILAAFGAGSLIAALSLELVAPTVEHLVTGGHRGGQVYINFFAMIIGAMLGGGLFVLLDQLINMNGGFIRKSATTLAYFKKGKKKKIEELLRECAGVPVLQNVPIEQVNSLVEVVRPVVFNPGEVLFHQGELGNRLYIIRSGMVEIRKDGELVSKLSEGDIVGEIALLTDAPRTAAGTAKTVVHALELSKYDFDKLREISPELDKQCRLIASQRIENLKNVTIARTNKAKQWAEEAVDALREGSTAPTPLEIVKLRHAHQGAPLAIWLGILLDGIPESFVIGAGVSSLLLVRQAGGQLISFHTIIPYTLIAGLFLSNFPEALASSVNMLRHKLKVTRIFIMWFSLMIMTALGSGVGYWLGGILPNHYVVFSQGLAAGAMLTMIASAMIPEAVHNGNSNLVGISTLLGFFASVLFKLFE